MGLSDELAICIHHAAEGREIFFSSPPTLTATSGGPLERSALSDGEEHSCNFRAGGHRSLISGMAEWSTSSRTQIQDFTVDTRAHDYIITLDVTISLYQGIFHPSHNSL